ncbi:MAG: tyrosine-type recombinase/integrase [Clostridia bacterium]
MAKILRERSGLNELFIINNHGIRNLPVISWTNVRLKSFIKRWDIRDKDGFLYPLKSHQFRATFVRELVKQNVSINHIMKQFSHVSIEMTMHYLTLQEHEIREIYTEMILSPESKIAGKRAEEIKSILKPHFKGKTAAEITTFISDLTETMSFNPLPNGICLYDFRRGNCTNGDSCFFYNCPNYITEAQFYPVLKRELELMELEMERFKKLGRERDWQRQYIKHKHLKKLVVELEVQINE